MKSNDNDINKSNIYNSNNYYSNNLSQNFNQNNYTTGYNGFNGYPTNFYSTNNQNFNYEAILNNNQNNKDGMPRKNNAIKYILLMFILIILILVIIIIINLLKSYEVNFYLNGADSIENTRMKCKSNYLGHCYLILPSATRSDGEVLGYSSKLNSKEAEYKVGEKIEMEEDMILYVISKKMYKFEIDTSDIDEVINENSSCEIYNTENVCKATVPMFNKLGYKIGSYVQDGNKVSFGSEFELKSNILLKPVYEEFDIAKKKDKNKVYTLSDLKAEYEKKHFNIEKSIYIYNTYLDIGYNCSKDISEPFINNLKKIYNAFPFYAYYSKIILLSNQDFLDYFGYDNAYGLTYIADTVNPSIFIRCDETLSTYISTVHELAHAFDTRYKNISGHKMSEEKDIIELKNKYINDKNRPLRDYAYSDLASNSIPEFFAELITYYYINYIDTTSNIGTRYKRGNYPDDMKKIAEKYICIGKNNYDASKC